MATRIQTQDLADDCVTADKLGITSTKGDLLGFSTQPERIPVGNNNEILIADSAQACGVRWATNTSNPNTTKGDLSGYSTGPTRVAVGSNGQILVADSTQAAGVKWTNYGSLVGIPTFIDSEVPSGTINGSNDIFTLANNPIAGSVHLYKNGLRQRVGGTFDYTISTRTLTFVAGNVPQINDVLLADYRY